ncbi:hypothetical protein BX600DRAFT_444586 [Xylariales sp. PMI_506]|nr:hypothetical protein BX600DRAFT_444586 [Xylariales sp. PMI_506]
MDTPITALRCLALLLYSSVAWAHVVITYPGWRGDNLGLNGTVADTDGLGVGVSGSELLYPYGMQWIYPCGGMPISSNRTKWPVAGGAVALQPGWYTGHKTALIYINMGFGAVPLNYSVPLVPGFEIQGPTNNPYPGTLCLPRVPLPIGYSPQVGDLATIQVVEAAVHGAALYSCVDIEFVELEQVAGPNETNCFNSTTISFVSDSTTPAQVTSSNTSTVGATQTMVATVTATNSASGVRGLSLATLLPITWLLLLT